MCMRFKMEQCVQWKLNVPSAFHMPLWSLGNLCCDQPGRSSALPVALLAWSIILPIALSVFSLSASVTASVGVEPCCTDWASWGASRAALHCSVGEGAINLLQFLSSPAYSYTLPTFQQKEVLNSISVYWVGRGKCFSQNKKNRDPI